MSFQRRRVRVMTNVGNYFDIESKDNHVIHHCMEAFTVHAEKNGLPPPLLEEERWVEMSHRWQKV